MRPKNTATGLNKELEVKRWLRRHGWEVPPHGTVGAEDIIAKDGSKIWYIQVKYTRKYSATVDSVLSAYSSEFRRLKAKATKHNAVPVYAVVIQDYVWFVSIKSFKHLAKGPL